MGAIEERAAANMPETFGALRKSKFFGSQFVANKSEFVKFRLFSTSIDPALEATTYNPVVLEFTGKVLALQLISPGLDMWGSEEISIRTTGTEESITFPDRVKMLLELQKRLWSEVNELQPLVEETISITPTVKARPRVSPEGEDKTADPQNFPSAYRQFPWGFDQEVSQWI